MRRATFSVTSPRSLGKLARETSEAGVSLDLVDKALPYYRKGGNLYLAVIVADVFFLGVIRLQNCSVVCALKEGLRPASPLSIFAATSSSNGKKSSDHNKTSSALLHELLGETCIGNRGI